MRILLSLIIIIASLQLYAQQKTSKVASAAIQIGNPLAISVSGIKNWHFGKSRKFSLGVGGRLTSAFGRNVNYITAPAKFTSGKTGPAVFFANNIPANIDSLTFSKINSNALNAIINIEYAITNKLSLAFNIDAVGLSVGGKKNAQYFELANATFSAKPTLINALLISDNDIGTLNSELVAAYKITPRYGARVGAGFLFTEYTTTAKIQTLANGTTNDRFRNKSLGITIGVQYHLQ